MAPWCVGKFCLYSPEDVFRVLTPLWFVSQPSKLDLGAAGSEFRLFGGGAMLGVGPFAVSSASWFL